MSIHDYFVRQLGTEPKETSLRDLPIDSPCGQDCRKVIDAAKHLLEVCDPSPNVRGPILEGVNYALKVFWLG